ncbi:MAG TPA: hypothetical protein GX692_05325 [Acholeplasmataceae bacterium]|nr:hypothetical protein [Acholeplasmataceae bacterium]
MIDFHDYKSYVLDNQDLIQFLRESKSIIYDRFEDVFQVLEFIEKRVEKYEKVEEEFEVIFEAGFAYLHEQMEELKSIINLYFKNDVAGLNKYASLINYYLYLSDLIETLTEKSLYSEDAKQAIANIYEEIETIFSEKKAFEQEIFNQFNLVVEEYAPVGTLSTQEIYGMIKEEIDVWE